MSNLHPRQEKWVMEEINRAELLQFAEIETKSGTEAPYYFDIRRAQSHPQALRELVKAYSKLLQREDRSLLIAGVPEAMTPIASIVGYNLHRSLVQPRTKTKKYGQKRSVEGDYKPGDRVILLDDVVTTGLSKIDVAKQIENADLIVEKFIVLIDGERGGRELVQEAGYDINCAFTSTSLLKYLFANEKITESQFEKAISYIKS